MTSGYKVISTLGVCHISSRFFQSSLQGWQLGSLLDMRLGAPAISVALCYLSLGLPASSNYYALGQGKDMRSARDTFASRAHYCRSALASCYTVPEDPHVYEITREAKAAESPQKSKCLLKSDAKSDPPRPDPHMFQRCPTNLPQQSPLPCACRQKLHPYRSRVGTQHETCW